MNTRMVFLSLSLATVMACTHKENKPTITKQSVAEQTVQETPASKMVLSPKDKLLAQKMAPYLDIEHGKYVFSLTLEEAQSKGIDSTEYTPVKECIETMNRWIEQYQIEEEKVRKGEKVTVSAENGRTLELSFIGEKEIKELKEKSAEVK